MRGHDSQKKEVAMKNVLSLTTKRDDKKAIIKRFVIAAVILSLTAVFASGCALFMAPNAY